VELREAVLAIERDVALAWERLLWVGIIAWVDPGLFAIFRDQLHPIFVVRCWDSDAMCVVILRFPNPHALSLFFLRRDVWAGGRVPDCWSHVVRLRLFHYN